MATFFKWFGYFIFSTLAAMAAAGLGLASQAPAVGVVTFGMFVMAMSIMVMLFEESYAMKTVSAIAFILCFILFLAGAAGTIFI